MAEEHIQHSATGIGEADLEQFRVQSPLEVVRILRDLARDHQLVTAYFNDGREFILTTVLHVDPEEDHLVLDYGPDELLNRRLLERQHAVFVTRHNQVRIQFDAERIIPANYQNLPAFVTPVPKSLIRVQRREYYRLTAPMGHHLNLSFQAQDGTVVNARIVDISIGGVGIIEPSAGEECRWEAGSIIGNCRIELPEEGVIEADIEIRNRYQTDTKDGAPVYRIGCRLLLLDSRRSAAIQRYIHRVELERRRVGSGD